MSFNKFEIKSFSSNKNTLLKTQLNEIWKQFMISFGYQKYYNLKEINQKQDSSIYNSTNNIFRNNTSCLSSTKSLFQFLSQNSIIIPENNNYKFLISSNKKGLYILSEPKTWIMYIIYIDQKMDNSEDKIPIIMNLFKEAINNNCDIISLFEFFLIYLSKIENFDFFINSNKIMEIIPKEFIFLYYKKKSILKSIFCKDDFNYLGATNEYAYTKSTIFSTDKPINNNDEFIFHNNEKKEEFKEFKLNEEKNNFKNNNICLDINNIIIICKDYLNKGFFAIFQEKKNNKENEEEILTNPFTKNEFDEEEDDFYLMPLLKEYNNYDQKMEANQTLNLINKSIYKNYTYCPYDQNIIDKL